MELRIALLFLAAGIAHAQSYTFTEFDVPGATAACATGINNKGEIVGWYFDSAETIHGFLRSANGATITTFDPAFALRGSIRVNGINNLGQIVGSFSDQKGFHGYIRQPNGDFTTFDITDLIPYPGPGPDATGINDLGEVVGAGSSPTYGGPGYLRRADGSLELLRAPSVGSIWPDAINNRGEVAGWALNGSSLGTQHGFLRSADGVYTKFDLPGTTSYTRILAINNLGRFAGLMVSGLGFVSNSDGTFTLLPGHEVFGMNDNGVIVGRAGFRPFIGIPGLASAEPSIRTELPGVLTASAFGGAASIGPGNWIEIYGRNLAPAAREWRASDFVNGAPPASLDGVSVSIGGVPAYVSYISPGQVNALVPESVAPGTAQVTVTNGGRTTNSHTLKVNAFQPTILSLRPDIIPNGSYAIALFPDFVTYALPPWPGYAGVPTRRPKAGDTIVLFGAGFGPVDPQSGKLIAPVEVRFSRAATVPGTVTYAGTVAGTVGLYQINVVVPDGLLYPEETFDDYVSIGVFVGATPAGLDSRQGLQLSIAR